MSNKPPSLKPLSAEQRMVQMTDAAKERYLAEKVGKIQPFLNENANIATIKNSAINAVVLAEIQCKGTPPVEEQPAMLERCLALAARISDAQLVRKWEDFRDCLVDQRETEVPPHLVWAAKQCGVDIGEVELKNRVRAVDEKAALEQKVIQ